MSAQDFRLPDLGEGLTDAEIVRWMVSVGDMVEVDQPVVEVVTAKASVELPSPFGGVVLTLHHKPGDVVKVGLPLLSIEREGGAPVGSVDASAASAEGPAPSEDNGGSGNVLVGYGTRPGRRRRRAGVSAPAATSALSGFVGGEARNSDIAGPATVAGAGATPPMSGFVGGEARNSDIAVAGAGATPPMSGFVGGEARNSDIAGPPPAETTPSAAAGNGRSPIPAVMSPVVRRLAREKGVDLGRLTGTGPNGLITRADVDAAVAQPSTTAGAALGDAVAAATATSAAPTSAAQGSAHPGARQAAGTANPAAAPQRIPIRGLHRQMAELVTRSRREIPEATVWVDVDASALLQARSSLASGTPNDNDRAAKAPAVVSLIARFCVLGLQRYPALNATIDGDEIVMNPGIHLGFAAQTDAGLVVPVVHDGERLSLAELDAEVRRLSEAARSGSLTTRDVTGGTFTVNNYGVFGVDGSAAIINHPQVAMIGIGRIIERPWVVDGAVVPRPVTQLTLAFDHRVCDGGVAGGYLRFVADCVEQPLRAL